MSNVGVVVVVVEHLQLILVAVVVALAEIMLRKTAYPYQIQILMM
jgi:hypothetical protein